MNPLEAYLGNLRAAGLAAGTQRLCAGYLLRLAEHMGGDLLTASPEQLVRFLGSPRVGAGDPLGRAGGAARVLPGAA